MKHGYCKRGIKRLPEYSAWMDMRGRCLAKGHQFFPLYGARGITICKEWDSFSRFLSDMGNRPSAKFSLDRIDNDGPYCKKNCRWANRETQDNNKRNTRRITWDGETLSLAQWERKQGIPKGNLHNRIKLGWSIVKALFTPVIPGRRTPKLMCKRGHSLYGDNIRVTSQGKRLCRECDKQRAKDRYKRVA